MMFMHRDAAWPGVVIEVSHSQKKSLVDLADTDIILGTYGGISEVVALDLDNEAKASYYFCLALKDFCK